MSKPWQTDSEPKCFLARLTEKGVKAVEGMCRYKQFLGTTFDVHGCPVSREWVWMTEEHHLFRADEIEII